MVKFSVFPQHLRCHNIFLPSVLQLLCHLLDYSDLYAVKWAVFVGLFVLTSVLHAGSSA